VVTFVQTTISEGEPTENGFCTADSKHMKKMRDTTTNEGVVGKVLDALGMECSDICYDDTKEEFVARTMNPEDAVQFVLMTSCQLPVQTGKPHNWNTKYNMKNLVVVHRSEVEKLGIVFE